MSEFVEEKLTEKELDNLEWALSFLWWYEKKYKKQHRSVPNEEK